uniref:Uncharacterized protein n=1 Tax=Lepeophtheirus salmonis TaxID=72036 RepID=A0A0K2TQD0_LEPSM
MFTANVASSSSPNAGGGANSSSSNRERDQIGSGGAGGHYHLGNHFRESHASVNVSELYCDEHSCLDSSHIHFKHSAVATAAAVAVCTYSGCQDGLSDEAREILELRRQRLNSSVQ